MMTTTKSIHHCCTIPVDQKKKGSIGTNRSGTTTPCSGISQNRHPVASFREVQAIWSSQCSTTTPIGPDLIVEYIEEVKTRTIQRPTPSRRLKLAPCFDVLALRKT